jgi:PAS domain S-box-containing protein
VDQAEALPSAADLRRGRLIVIGLTCLAGLYAVLFAAASWLMHSPRLGAVAALALLGFFLYSAASWLIVSGRFTWGMRLFIAGVLAVVLGETFVIPDEQVTWLIAAFVPFALALQFTRGRTPLIAAAAGLLVAVNALVIRSGLHFSSGFPPDVVGWLDVAGGTIALLALALLFFQIREMSDAQQELARDRAAELNGVVNASPDAVIGMDVHGTVTSWNRQAEALFGWTAVEMVGSKLVDRAVPPEFRNAHRAGLRDFRETGEAPVVGKVLDSLRGIRKDGGEFPIELVITRQNTRMAGIHFIGFVRDLTERRRLERQLQQTQRLESLGQLAGGVAHDFNNLLGAILGYTSFVKEAVEAAARGAITDDWIKVGEDVEQIEQAADRATRLTHQLLAFARREVVQPAVINVNEVVANLEELLRRTLGEHVELRTSLASALGSTVIDPGQLEQVLVNLAVNARDAMPDGGGLSIETENALVDEDYAASRPGVATGHYIRLRVSDTGAGMDEATLQRAFEPFFTTKPKGSGTGLGLATVYGVITQAGGQAFIYSEPGHGTTFTALLPAAEVAPQPEPAHAARLRRAGGSETILLVEDEDALREVTARMLTRNGYRVLSAAGGAEAIEAATNHEEIDLLITDVVMPHMLGREVATRVVELRPNVGVLFISGYAQPVLGSRGTLDAGVALLEKPFAESALLDKVQAVIDGRGH